MGLGLPGLITVFAALIALTYWILFQATSGRPYLSAFVVILAAFASAIVWGARPQIFNLLLTAVFVLVVERVKQEQLSRRWLWALPLLTLLWAIRRVCPFGPLCCGLAVVEFYMAS